MILNEEVEQLFQDTKRAFECAPINKYASEHGLKWYYSISATKLTSNANVIVGFNWGVEGKYKYQPQTTIPNDNFKDLYNKKWLGSFQRIYNPLKNIFRMKMLTILCKLIFAFLGQKKKMK